MVRINLFSICTYFYLGCKVVLYIAHVPDQGRERQILFSQFQFHKTPHSDDGLVDEKEYDKGLRFKATSYSQRAKKMDQQKISKGFLKFF